jgi:hypothetical protein
VKQTPPVAIQAAQAIAASLVFAGLGLIAAVVRGVFLLLSPDSRAVFEQVTGGDANAAAYSVILGYGLPALAFTILYLVVALRITRGRRWTWVLGLLLSITGVALCFTTVSKLLSLVANALIGFQVVLALLLLVSSRYFWSAPASRAAGEDAAPGPVSDAEEALSDAPEPTLSEAPSREAEPSS